jgi:hypothetical protein
MSHRAALSSPRLTAAALALAASLGWMAAAPAQAQALAPNQIERMLGDNGYRLMGPVVRHGRVYLASVLGQQDEELRLVVDARNGRVLQRYPGSPTVARQGNPDEGSPLGNFFDRLFGHTEEVAPLSPPPKSDFLETPKPKAQFRRPNPAVQPAAIPTDNKTNPATPGVATPATPVPTPAVATPATSPAVAPPAAASSTPAPPPVAPPATSVKATPTPETAAAAPAKPAAKTSSPKINDVPVAPLE